ncbi:hypothetical protein KI387_033347, partial [Taxus chinensis]
EASKCSGGVDLSVFNELEKRHGELFAFVERLVAFSRDRSAGRAHSKLPNLVTLNTPIDPVPVWWVEIRESTGEAYDYLWRNWTNVVAAMDPVEE